MLVAGCGYVGTALAIRLVEDGYTVWGLRRDVSRLPAGVLPVSADLDDPDTLQGLPPDLDVVVYTAAADRSDPGAYRAAYVDGLQNLLDALVSGGQQPRRVLFTSSTAVYAQMQGEWVDEQSPTEAADFTGKIMLEGEGRVLSGPFPGTVLRLGGIYGPGRTRLVEQVRSGQAICTPAVYSNRIHRDDCAGALRHLMLLEQPEPIYLGVDRESAELCAIQGWLAEQLGAPPPQVKEEGTSRRRRSNKRCSSERLVRSGYRFHFPTYREGFASLLA